MRRIEDLGTFDIITQIQEALDTFDLETARKLLRIELKENPTADVYFLAARAAIDDQQRQSFLEKAVEYDPFHQEARTGLQKLQTRTSNLSYSTVQPTQANLAPVVQRQQSPAQESFYQTSHKDKVLYPDQSISQQLHLHRTEQQVNVNVAPPTVVIVNKRSRFVALLLTLFLGPFGMFYSTTSGAFIMLVIFFLAAIGGAPPGAFSVLWLICLVWSVSAASRTPQIVAA